MINKLIAKIIKETKEVNFSSSLLKLKNFWNPSSHKFKKTVIVGTILLLLPVCCLCGLLSPSTRSTPPQSPTISKTDISATSHLGIDLQTEVVPTSYTELGKTQQPLSTPTIVKVSISTPSPFPTSTSTNKLTSVYSEIGLRTEIAATLYAEIEKTQQSLSTPTIEKISTPKPSSTLPILDKKIIVTFIDVGQGDAILIRSPEGLFALIDGGEQGSGVVDYLRNQDVQNLDLVIATHPNSDHIGGLVEVLKNYPVTRVITNGELHTTLVYENFLDAIALSQADYSEVKQGDSIQIGSLTLEVLHPEHIIEGGLNKNSIVLRLDYLGTSFLFTGDASKDNEGEMISAGLPLKADILKVGHHGSDASTSSQFLSSVHPAVAIYLAGKGNSYGHPSSDTVKRIINSGAQIYGTDVNGTVKVEVDETGYSVQPEKKAIFAVVEAPVATSQVQENIKIDVISLTSPISAGSIASLTIQTLPGSNCSIAVYYKSGASQAAGLGPQKANASGLASWSWKVGARTTPGRWSISVQSILNDKSATISIPFEVK